MCRGSCFSSPRSTLLTMSVRSALARQVMPSFSPSRTIWPLMNSISVRRPFAISWPIEGRCPLAIGKTLRVIGFGRRLVALARPRDRLWRKMQDVLELIAVRLPDPDRLAADPGGEAADRLVLQHLAAGKAGAGREPVLHRVGDQLGPALAPEIVGDQRAVGKTDQPADFLGALGDAAVHLAGPEHGVRRAALPGAAVDVAGLGQVHADAAGDAAERLAPADDAGDGLLVHAVLQRHDKTVRCEILPDHHGRPRRVVGLHADKGDVDRLFLGELLG